MFFKNNFYQFRRGVGQWGSSHCYGRSRSCSCGLFQDTIFHFLQFDYDMPMNSLGSYPAWWCLSFLDLWFHVCHYFQTILSHYCFKHFFCSSLSFLSGIPNLHMLLLLQLFSTSGLFYSLLFSFFFSLCVSGWAAFIDLTSSSLILFLAMSIKGILYFCYNFQLFLSFTFVSQSVHFSTYISLPFLHVVHFSHQQS